jgi:hypothetical protein
VIAANLRGKKKRHRSRSVGRRLGEVLALTLACRMKPVGSAVAIEVIVFA